VIAESSRARAREENKCTIEVIGCQFISSRKLASATQASSCPFKLRARKMKF